MKQDLTGFAALGCGFCQVQLNEDKNRLGETLKKAAYSLKKAKGQFMANGEILETLIKFSNIKQIVSDKENLYGEQIKGKLEVVGTHLEKIISLLASILMS